MIDIDTIQINFNPDQLFLLNICLAFLMFAVAIDIKLNDFVQVFKNPKVAFVGLFSQLILLPLLTIGLILIFKPAASVALGMILVAACPGGNVSNYAVHLAKGNSAVSIILTSTTTILSIFITPLAFLVWSKLIPGLQLMGREISIDPIKMVQTIFTLILIPLVVGMLLNHFFESAIERIKKPVKYLSMAIFVSFVIFGIIGNLDNIVAYLGMVFTIVVVHNLSALCMGYYFAKFTGLVEKDRRAIAIETGIQNSGLALIIIFNIFDGLGGMAIIAAFWGIWHLITGFGLALYWEKKGLS